MNKVFNILIALVFLVTSVGVQINKHYSHGKLYSTALFHEAETCCNSMENTVMSGMTQKECEHETTFSHSCENKSQFYQVDLKFIMEENSVPAVNSIDLFSVLFIQKSKQNLDSKDFNQLSFHNPPPIIVPDFQKEFGVFIC